MFLAWGSGGWDVVFLSPSLCLYITRDQLQLKRQSEHFSETIPVHTLPTASVTQLLFLM
jgi:hypothetical protein